VLGKLVAWQLRSTLDLATYLPSLVLVQLG
jgi:hypothetical protein